MKGLIVKGIGGFYYVETESGEVIRAKGRGALKRDGFLLMVGDMVEVEEGRSDEEDGVITEVMDRHNSFERPPIANVDKLICVISMSKPKPNLLILDKLLAMAESKAVEPMICINKCDEGSIPEGEKIVSVYDGIYPVVMVSGLKGANLDVITEFIGHGKAAMVGPSGVGKSTLTNALIPEANMDVGSISHKTDRGRHTTRHVEIFHIGEGYLFDTPGFTSLYGEFESEEEVELSFPEIKRASAKCKFDDCRHISEPQCRVREEVEKGSIPISRYNSYRSILEEMEEKKRY